jgi:hypothetical protein
VLSSRSKITGDKISPVGPSYCTVLALVLLPVSAYARKDELVQKKILPRATYEQIKYKIVAKQK